LIHTYPVDLTKHASVSLPVYRDGPSLWRQGNNSGGEINVAPIGLALYYPSRRQALPAFALVVAALRLHE
jgi:hypothetical protein